MPPQLHQPQQYPTAPPSAPSLTDLINAHIAARLVECRQAHNLSQEDLGRRIGVTGAKIAEYETCAEEMPASTLFKLACALTTSFEYFYSQVN